MEKFIQDLLLNDKCQVAPMSFAGKKLILSAYKDALCAINGNAEACIETGTLHGDTTECLSEWFRKVVTIESYQPLYEKAKDRFSEKDNISVIFGDSGKMMEDAIGQCDATKPILFFLDAHFSGEGTGRGEDGTTCPTFKELFAIQKNLQAFQDSVILIDDMRNFGDPTKTHYPTQEYVTEWARMNRMQCRKSSDMIQIAGPKIMNYIRQKHRV